MTYDSNNLLSLYQMTVNAQYIMNYLTAQGWTKNAVAAMLGNMQTESTINPGVWENLDSSNALGGYGLVQWTPSTNYTNWAKSQGLVVDNIDSQMKRILYEVANKIQWYATKTYPMTFSQFTKSTQDPTTLANAFLLNYERPANQNQPIRGTNATYWYNNLIVGGTVTNPTPTPSPTPSPTPTPVPTPSPTPDPGTGSGGTSITIYPSYPYREGIDLSDLNLKSYDKLYPLYIRKYQNAIIDPNANEVDKINQIVDYLNQTGRLANDVVQNWNNVMAWVMNDGLNTDVTNKINAMVADGTFDTLFNQYLAPSLGDITKLNTNTKDNFVDAVNETFGDVQVNTAAIGDLTKLPTAAKDSLVNSIIEVEGNTQSNAASLADITNNQLPKKASQMDIVKNKYRRDNNKIFSAFTLPIGFTGTFKPINIYRDAQGHYTTDFVATNFQNPGTHTYYVSPNGVSTNDGLTTNTPTTINKAIGTYAVDGDTIIFMAGNYFRSAGLTFPLTIGKSLNLIGQGVVNIFCGDNFTYTLDSTTGLYTGSRSSTHRIIDSQSPNFCVEYTSVSSIAACQATKGTWYTDNTTIYVNPFPGVNPNGRLIPLVTISDGIVCSNTNNMTVYFENLNIIGCMNNIKTNQNPSYSLACTLNGVNGYYSQKVSGGNNFWFGGGNILCYNCKSMFSGKDGFNYNQYNASNQSVICNFVEINCIGANNGLNDSAGAFNNGSTCHAGTHGIRINGTYYGNFGGNVTDVQTGTQTVNLGCVAFDSTANTQDQSNTDFCAQQAGTEMWIYDCIAFGSLYSIYPVSGTTIHNINSQYETSLGGGTITTVA